MKLNQSASEGRNSPPAWEPRPGFEPIAVADGSSGVADELNRASEGASLGRDATPSLGTTLRLTHDAALAWLNVLTRTTTSDVER
jgi:hypothetical protein